MLLKNAYHRENIAKGIKHNFRLICLKYGFKEIEYEEELSAKRNLYGYAIKKNNLILFPIIDMFEYEIHFLQNTKTDLITRTWVSIYRSFEKRQGIDILNDNASLTLWREEIPFRINYSKPISENDIKVLISLQFEFLERHFPRILKKGELHVY